LLDRLLHHAEIIAINGNSYRMKDRRRDIGGTAKTEGGQN
jgi:DNA replication protein DnaC